MDNLLKKKLIVGGCSMTHGAELVDGFMHPGNVDQSYSRYLAEWLDADLINVALCGGSNDDIFHTLMQQIENTPQQQVHSVIAAWTWHGRLHWTNKGRHWFFTAGWASTMRDLYNWQPYAHQSSLINITSDNPDLLQELENQHRFFSASYLDDLQWFKNRLENYKSALRSHCDSRKIHLVQINLADIWRGRRHPTAQEHRDLAKIFYEQYYKQGDQTV